jgi:hypothetical protein
LEDAASNSRMIALIPSYSAPVEHRWNTYRVPGLLRTAGLPTGANLSEPFAYPPAMQSYYRPDALDQAERPRAL